MKVVDVPERKSQGGYIERNADQSRDQNSVDMTAYIHQADPHSKALSHCKRKKGQNESWELSTEDGAVMFSAH